MEYVNYENLGAESYNPDTEKQKGVRENMYRYTRNSSVIAALVLGYVAYKVKNPST